MTQYYKVPQFTLAASSPSTKILITLYLVFNLFALWVSILQYADRAGMSHEASTEWLLGNEGDLEAREFKAEKSDRELLSITHEHAFTLPMLFFLLLHMVALCTISERWKIALYVLSFLALGGSFAGMWLVARVGPGWSWLLRASGVGMTLSIAVSSLLCLWETWGVGGWQARRDGPPPLAPNPMFPRLREQQGGASPPPPSPGPGSGHCRAPEQEPAP